MQNLEFIEAAKDELALEKRLPDGYAPDWSEVSAYLRKERIPRCPAGYLYLLEEIGEPCRCPYHGAHPQHGE